MIPHTHTSRFKYLPPALCQSKIPFTESKAELAQVGTFFPARISALASKMGQIKKNKATTLYQMIYYD